MLLQSFKILWKNRNQNFLILIEILVSFIILAGVFAYLLGQWAYFKSPLGFETKNRTIILFSDYIADMDSLEYLQKTDNLRQNLQNQKEVVSHSFGNMVYPFSFNNWNSTVEINNTKFNYCLASLDHEYQKTMNVEMARGRWFSPPLSKDAVPEVVVNQLFYDQAFGNKDMIDSIIKLSSDVKIVGVVPHYKYNGDFSEEQPIVLFHQDYRKQQEATTLYLELQDGTPSSFYETLHKLVLQSTGRKDFIIKDLEERRKEQNRSSWLTIIIITCLAMFIVINVALGLFGVIWYNIQKRTYEISLRKSLGATSTDILLQFVTELMGLSTLGIIVGIIFGLQIIYFGLVPSLDPSLCYQGIIWSAIFISVLVALCAMLPSWKASRQSPSKGLKEE